MVTWVINIPKSPKNSCSPSDEGLACIDGVAIASPSTIPGCNCEICLGPSNKSLGREG